ncbi:hypothetical protein N7478_004630 [Penicillium angulare]|uniref:uncharacterized protein n=1 Tax=Penicillium angulare TaxID=116970 RepID=UPI002540A90D|nr:uncharacterized protein N7478_004630 [Penicillium angulare]KAJ5279258.1 hypothetical protein N7478_004630 [Penicillium angulare]
MAHKKVRITHNGTMKSKLRGKKKAQAKAKASTTPIPPDAQSASTATESAQETELKTPRTALNECLITQRIAEAEGATRMKEGAATVEEEGAATAEV